MQCSWTPEIYGLIETLASRVRVLSLKQIHQGWPEMQASPQGILPTVNRLVQAGLLIGDIRKLQEPPITELPLCNWSPGYPKPNFELLKNHIQSRWDGPPLSMPIVAATQKACNLFGSSAGEIPPLTHLNHDLLLAQVHIQYRCQQPELCENWLGEDAVEMAEHGIKNPDAFLFDSNGNVARVIESTGNYSLKQLESFHHHCQVSDLPYELW